MAFRKLFIAVAVVLAGAAGVFAYTKAMARISTVEPPPLAAKEAQADRIMVSKVDKTLYLLQGDKVLKSYRISMGGRWDEGHKQREGDERTPEGSYQIDWRNERSRAYLSLHISYPNAEDSAQAQAAGYSAGGDIMIHGLPNGLGWFAPVHHLMDWTDGCIAVTNEEMREIWSLVSNNTPITIQQQWRP